MESLEKKKKGLCDYKPDICKMLMPKAGQELRAKLETQVGHRGCRKKAVKAEAKPSQDPEVSPTHSLLLLASLCDS